MWPGLTNGVILIRAFACLKESTKPVAFNAVDLLSAACPVQSVSRRLLVVSLRCET